MTARNLSVLDGAGATQTIRGLDDGAGSILTQSVPTDTAGAAMIGQRVSSLSLPVVMASDQSALSVSVSNLPATQPVSASTLPLPAGASTDTNLTSIAGSAGTSPPALASGASGLVGWLRKIVDTLTSSLTVSWSGSPNVTVANSSIAISASTLPLPTGAGTAANQSLILTALGSPFQAGASIANTTFASTQSGTWTVNQGAAPWSQNLIQVAGVTLGTPVNAGLSWSGAGISINAMTPHQTATDIASAAITTTSTSSVITSTGLPVAIFAQAVTAVSGTTPTLKTVVQWSADNVNWQDLYHFATVSTTGFEQSPSIRVPGLYLRYVRTVTGTTPSFTMSLIRNYSGGGPPSGNPRRFFDTAIVPTTLGSFTATYNIEGVTQTLLGVSSGAATTPASFQLQISEDGAQWFAVGSPTASAASTNTIIYNGIISAKFARAIVTTAGTAQTLNYISFSAR
jgi:hypothetical protein